MKKIIIKIECDAEDLSNKKSDTKDSTNLSCHARFFDSTCPHWSKDPEVNKMFLKTVEQYANDRLKAQGYLFLNDVYDLLGMARTKSGQILGWVVDDKNPIGDNRVDFGIFSDHNKNFVNGLERDALLDFNIDGCILDCI